MLVPTACRSDQGPAIQDFSEQDYDCSLGNTNLLILRDQRIQSREILPISRRRETGQLYVFVSFLPIII